MSFRYLFLDPSHVAPKTWNPRPARGPWWPGWRRDVPLLITVVLGIGLVAVSVRHQPPIQTSLSLTRSGQSGTHQLAPADIGQLWQPAPPPRSRSLARRTLESPTRSAPPAPVTDMPLFDDGRLPAP